MASANVPTIAPSRTFSTGRVSLQSAELTHDGKGIVWSARMTPDGKRVVAGNGKAKLDVWDAATAKRVHELSTDDAIVTHLSLSADGKRAATAAGNNRLRLWDLERGAPSGSSRRRRAS